MIVLFAGIQAITAQNGNGAEVETRAKNGDTEAMVELGKTLFFAATRQDKKTEEALDWFIKAAEKDNDLAFQEIWIRYGQDYGEYPYVSDKLKKKAFEFLQKRAKKGNAAAQLYLGNSYNDRWFNLQENKTEALKWYSLAAAQGNVDAQFATGEYYHKNKNYDEALKWYKKAAEKDNAYAAYNIGRMYFYGEGVGQDYAQAMQWFSQANIDESLYLIGKMYYEGLGVTKDYTQAQTYFKKTEYSGEALLALGKMYYKGEGIPKNDALALEYFQKAAETFANEEAKKLVKEVAEVQAENKKVENSQSVKELAALTLKYPESIDNAEEKCYQIIMTNAQDWVFTPFIYNVNIYFTHFKNGKYVNEIEDKYFQILNSTEADSRNCTNYLEILPNGKYASQVKQLYQTKLNEENYRIEQTRLQAEQKAEQVAQARIEELKQLKNLKKGDKISGKYYLSSHFRHITETIEGEVVQWNNDRSSLLIKVTKASRHEIDLRWEDEWDYNSAYYNDKNIKSSENIWITNLLNDDAEKDYFWSIK
jgi:TPR repeat protein